MIIRDLNKTLHLQLLEEAKLRFNFASRKTENTDLLSDLLKKMRDTVDHLPVSHGRRGREAAPRKIRNHLRFKPPTNQYFTTQYFTRRYDNRRGGHVQAVSERLLPDAVGLGVDFRNILIGSLF